MQELVTQVMKGLRSQPGVAQRLTIVGGCFYSGEEKEGGGGVTGAQVIQ